MNCIHMVSRRSCSICSRALPTECSALIENGRLVCDCLRGKPEVRADISVCHPKMLDLMVQGIDAAKKP